MPPTPAREAALAHVSLRGRSFLQERWKRFRALFANDCTAPNSQSGSMLTLKLLAPEVPCAAFGLFSTKNRFSPKIRRELEMKRCKTRRMHLCELCASGPGEAGAPLGRTQKQQGENPTELALLGARVSRLAHTHTSTCDRAPSRDHAARLHPRRRCADTWKVSTESLFHTGASVPAQSPSGLDAGVLSSLIWAISSIR